MKIKQPNIATLFLVGSMLIANALGDTPEKDKESLDLFLRLLGEQMSGERADYVNAKIEWRPIIEARARNIIFTYWVYTSRFGIPKNPMIEVRFGELSIEIEKAGRFEQTFENPSFILSSNEFPRHSYTSADGQEFSVRTIDEFRKVNQEFLVFLASCEAAVKEREHSRQVKPNRAD